MSSPSPEFYFPVPRSQKYCSQCAHPLTQMVPPGDNRLRDVCENCGAVHYQNPRNVVGVLPIWDGKILLCKRAIEPRYGMWTLPAGFMELNETTAEGALRETDEEAGASVELSKLYTVIDVPHAEQVHFYYLGNLRSPELNPGPETLETMFVTPDEIPWDDLAFRTVRTTLEHYCNDVKRGRFDSHFYALETPFHIR